MKKTILGILVCACLGFGKPPYLPAFVKTYFHKNKISFSEPAGKLDPETITAYRLDTLANPGTLTADFNGDRILDFAGILKNPNGNLDIIVVFSSGKKYRHFKLKGIGKDAARINVVLNLQKPDTVFSFPYDGLKKNEEKILLKNPAIEIVFPEVSESVFYWDKNKFKEIQTED